MPGSGGVSRATQAALSSGAPACGQRLSSAKNSPLTWNTTMSRPSTPPPFFPPGGVSGSGGRVGWEREGAPDIFGRVPPEMRGFIAEARKMLIHPPHRRWNPAEPAFDEHD